MIPDFRIEVDGADRTDRFRIRSLDIKIADEEGTKSDRLDLSFDDRDAAVPLPPQGAMVRVWLGYRSGGPVPVDMGTYRVDEITLGSGPRSVQVRAKAAEFTKGLRAPKTRSWHRRTLGDIAGTIAAEHGLSPMVAPALGTVQVDHVDQTEESDANFLTRLAGDHGAVAKPAGGALILSPKGADTLPDGSPMPRFTLRATDLTNWKVTISERGDYGAVTAWWQDNGSGERRSVTVGATPGEDEDDEAKEPYQLRETYRSEAEARAAADAKRGEFQAGKRKLSASMPGRPDLFAGAAVTLTGARPGADGDYRLTRVDHHYTTGGYTTSIDAENKPAGDEGDDADD